MNHYTELLYYLKGILESDPLVNTVTQGELDMVSLNKMDIYMLCHIVINEPLFTNGQTVGFNVEVLCCDVVDINKEVNEDKFFKNDNEVDVLNETLAVLNRFWTKLNQDFERKGITTDDNVTLQQWLNDKDNAVGYVLPFTVQMPNKKMNLCQ